MSDKATVGNVIAAFLEIYGVGSAFGVISIHNMPFLDAIGQRANIRCQRRSKISPPGRIKISPLDVIFSRCCRLLRQSIGGPAWACGVRPTR